MPGISRLSDLINSSRPEISGGHENMKYAGIPMGARILLNNGKMTRHHLFDLCDAQLRDRISCSPQYAGVLPFAANLSD